MRKANESYVIGLYSDREGHAVTAVKVIDDDSRNSRIQVYDTNYPGNSKRFIKINTGLNSWIYPIDDRKVWKGTAQSKTLTLIPLSIQNVDQTVYSACPGGSATFTVYATGSNLTYTWYHEGVLIPGESSATLTINNITPLDTGSYTPIVANQCGRIEAPSPYIEMCFADFNCSGDITPQDLFAFLPAWFSKSPLADVNRSGTITVQDLFDWLNLWFMGYC